MLNSIATNLNYALCDTGHFIRFKTVAKIISNLNVAWKHFSRIAKKFVISYETKLPSSVTYQRTYNCNTSKKHTNKNIYIFS